MNKKAVVGFIIVSFILSLTACKSKLKLFTYDTSEIKIAKLIDHVESKYLDINTLSVKFQVKYIKGSKKQVIHGMYRIRKDSIIWLSMGPTLGMEVFRAVLEKDTLKFMNRFDKTFYVGSYNYINNVVNIDLSFKTIENILLNRFVIVDSKNDSWKSYLSKNFDYKIESDRYLLKKNNYSEIDNNNVASLLDSIVIIPDIYKVEKMVWRQNEKSLIIDFKDFVKVENTFFPKNYVIHYKEGEEKQSFDLKIKQISINKKIKYPYRVSKKFTQIVKN